MDEVALIADILNQPLNAKSFLEGPAGTGKTSAGVERMLHMMEQGVPGGSILVLAPQRTLASPYSEALRLPGVVAGGMVTVSTVGGLARRSVDAFWPLISEKAGFAHPDRPPVFLNLESAQYYMAHVVRPLLAQGHFDSVVLDRNRMYSQILDNLNKAATVGFPLSEISERLKRASLGNPAQERVYADAQDCAIRFRQYCLAHNLLDFSLLLEIFRDYLWNDPLCRSYLWGTYQHLIFDNVEEDTPVSHDMVEEWLPHLESALLIYDHDAGLRIFLAADPQSALRLKPLCNNVVVFDQPLNTSPAIQQLEQGLKRVLSLPDGSLPQAPAPQPAKGPRPALEHDFHRFYPQMLDWTAEQIARLVRDEGTPPGEIAVLAPFLSDALRDEPATQCLLSLASLVHPEWGFQPDKFDVAYALVQAIGGLDLVRAQLLAEATYQPSLEAASLLPFEQVRPETRERITYRLGQRYESLRLWLAEYSQGPRMELDVFLSRLFGEVLSQPGFGFHTHYAAGEVTANLIDSVQNFRQAAGDALAEEGIPLGKEYMLMVQDGVIAAQYIRSWLEPSKDAVFLAPAYTFLMTNRAVDYQFWLDVGSRGWFERLYQPLTHPYVLSRGWPPMRTWSEMDEYAANQDTLLRLVLGLVRRCRRGVFLGLSELGEQGYEQRGYLLQALHRMLIHWNAENLRGAEA